MSDAPLPWLVVAAGGALETAFLPQRVFDLRAASLLRVSVALSPGGIDLVSLTAMTALSGGPVYHRNDHLDERGVPLHLRWSRCDLLVVYPATARILAEAALGIVGCAVTRLIAFTPKERIAIVPAIHPRMDRVPYREHLARLAERGCSVLGGDDLFGRWNDVTSIVNERLRPARRPTPLGPLLLDALDPPEGVERSKSTGS